MKWLNLDTSFLHHRDFIGSEPTVRATWLSVSLWSAEQETSGRIVGARAWKDRQWQQTCGVTLGEVDAASPLLVWENDDLVVWGYPLEQEKTIKAKRHTARQNGQAGGRPPKAEPTPEPMLVLKSDSTPAPTSESVREKEEEEEKKYIAPPSGDRDALFEALAKAEGSDPTQLTPKAKRRIAVALNGILKAAPGVTPREIASRGQALRRLYPTVGVSAHSLEMHWAQCSGRTQPVPAVNVPRFNDDELRALEQTEPDRFRALAAQHDEIRSQALRLGLLKRGYGW